MADIGSEVHITGSDLPQWATETTAQQMMESISDLVDLTRKQQNDIVKELKKNGKITEKTAKDISTGSGLAGTLGKDLKEAGHSALDTAGGFDKLNKGPLKNFGAALKKSSLSMKLGLVGIGLFGQAIGMSIRVIKDSTAAMRDMADSGVTIAGGMAELQSSLADTGMTLAEAGEIVGKYSQVVGVNGFRAITKLTKSVNAADNGFMKYGLTTAEATEFTAEFLEQQRLAGVFGRRRQADQAIAIKENIERLTAYSKILNVSRKHMMETTTTMMNREDVQARFAAMDEEQRVKAQAAYAETIQAFTALGPKGEEFGTMLTDVLGNPIAEASETFRQLAQVSPNLGRAMADASRQVAAGIPVTAEQAKSMMELAAQNKDTLVAMSIMDNEVGNLAKKLLAASIIPEQAAITELKNQEAFEAAKRKNENLTREEFNKSVASNVQIAASLDDALNILRATLVSEVTKTFLDLVGPSGEKGIRGAIKGIHALTDTISVYGAKFREWIDSIRTSENPFSAILETAMRGIGVILEKIGNMLVGAIQRGFQMLTESSIVGQAQKGVGGVLDWLSGINEDTELALMTPTEQRAEERKRFYSKSGGTLGFSAEQIKRSIQESQIKTTAPAAPKGGAPTTTAPTATEPGMSDTDIAKLDIAGQQLYYTKRLVRLVESNGGLMA